MTYYVDYATKRDVPEMHGVLNQASANLGGPTHTDTIAGYLRPSRLAVVVRAGGKTVNQVVAVSLSRFPTKGVGYHQLFAVSKAVRGQGIGGSLLAAVIRLMQAEGRFHSHKWFASVPGYNLGVQELYQAQGWAHEGSMRKHTKNKTDLELWAFYPDTMEAPKYWHELGEGRPEVISLLVGDSRQITGGAGFGLTDGDIDQGRDGEVW